MAKAKAMGEGAGSGGALVPPMYTNAPCPRCGATVRPTAGDEVVCSRCGWRGNASTDLGKAFTLDWEFKAVAEDEHGTLVIEGYANTWQEDRDGETVARDAFEESLAEYLSNPVILLNHDKHKPIGSIKYAATDDLGLYTIGEIPKPAPDSEPWHHKAYSDIKRGILKAFSMGGVFYRSKAVEGLIYKVDLYEVSVVTIPANQASLFSVAAVKGLEEWATLADAKTKPTGVGRGHGRHHHGPIGARGPRARHRHANGIRHRHRGGLRFHRHRRKDAAMDETQELREFMVEDSADGDDLYDVEADAEMGELGVVEFAAKAYALEDDFDDIKAEQRRGNPQALRDYFTSGAGGRINWGTPGDFNRCVAIAGKFMDDPQGFCQLRHEEATGAPAGQAPGEGGRGRGGKENGMDWEGKREYSQAQREEYARSGIAMPDGGYPIPDKGALRDAIQAFGRGSDKPAVKRHIIKRARALGAVDMLPDDWKSAAEFTEKEATLVGEEGTKTVGDKIEISRKEWEESQAVVKALAEEKAARDQQAKVEKMAKEKLEAEEKAAKEREEADAKAAAEVARLVDERVKALRAGVTSGQKMRYGGDPNAGVTGAGQKGGRITDFMNALIRAKHGDPEAHKFLVQEDSKAAAEYGLKAYAEGTTGAGGFLVPPQYLQSGIAEFRIAQAKVRQLCTRIAGINSSSVLIPRETGISSVGWTAENTAKPSTDATFGQITVGIYTLAGIAKVSRQLLEDSSPAVDAIVRRDLGKALGQAEDIAFINGTGTGQPTGILNTAGVLTGAIGSKLWSSIAGAISTVQSNYFGNPTAILAHPRDVNTLRTTTDTTGRPIFLPNYFQGNDPSRGGAQAYLAGGAVNPQAENFPMSIGPDGYVFGLPVYSDANIPTNLGAGTNETRLIIAAWDEAWVLDRVGMNMDVSSEAGTSFEQNQVWFRVEERVGFTAARQPSAFYVMTGLTPGAGL